MRKRFPSFLLPLAILATAGTPWLATQAADSNGAPAGAASSARSMAADAAHQRLAGLAGRWSVRQSLWSEPGKPPAVDQGNATFTPLLGGRHLRQDLRIDAPGKPFQGLGYLGYDQVTGKYDSLWMDVSFDGVILARGSYDESRKTYTFLGAGPDPTRPGASLPLREVMQVRDADHFTYDYYERHAGKEALAVRLEYTRVK